MHNLILGLGASYVASLIENKDPGQLPLTIVKVGGPDYRPTPQDLEKWRLYFEGDEEDIPAGLKDQPVEIEELDLSHNSNDHCVVLVRVGDENYTPTEADLNHWRDVFEQAAENNDFRIFTHHAINIDVINFGPGKVLVDRS